MSAPIERTITMTVYAIHAEQMDATRWGEPAGYRYLNGNIKVKAHGEGEWHEWVLRGDQRCWPGDRITVTVIEDAPEFASTTLTPPAIDKRG